MKGNRSKEQLFGSGINFSAHIQASSYSVDLAQLIIMYNGWPIVWKYDAVKDNKKNDNYLQNTPKGRVSCEVSID